VINNCIDLKLKAVKECIEEMDILKINFKAKANNMKDRGVSISFMITIGLLMIKIMIKELFYINKLNS